MPFVAEEMKDGMWMLLLLKVVRSTELEIGTFIIVLSKAVNKGGSDASVNDIMWG